LRLRKKIFVEELNVPLELEVDEYDCNAIHFVAVVKRQIIATARLIVSENKGKVGRFCV
jgi:predicted GNAT family N-acyltransferase